MVLRLLCESPEQFGARPLFRPIGDRKGKDIFIGSLTYPEPLEIHLSLTNMIGWV